MYVAASACALAAMLAWVSYARRASILTLLVAFAAVGYVLGPYFWAMKAGPLTLNAERIGLVALLAACWMRRNSSGVALRPWVAYDWALVAFVGYLTVRCALTDAPLHERTVNGPWWRLASSFWIPALLYFAARSAELSEATWRRMLGGWTLLGVYLGLTACAEITAQWWAVFPRYIANPELGTHFGRARGPMLMSASLGVYLTVCFWACWMLSSGSGKKVRPVLCAAMIVMAAGVYFTYTRSTWMGLAGGLAIVPLLQCDRRMRPLLLTGMLLLGVLGGASLLGKVKSMGRGDEASAEHSVYQRASFTYVTLRMFEDAPLFGHGFGRFFDKKLPYLADRRQQIELDSIRSLDHHITPFSILTETGIVGLLLYLFLLAAWWRSAWRLVVDVDCAAWERRHGLFAIGVGIAYLASAMFHDLTLSPAVHWALFTSAGISVGLAAERRRAERARATLREASSPIRLPDAVPGDPAATRPALARFPGGNRSPRISLLGMQIDPVNLEQAVDEVLAWCARPLCGPCRYVVTPNVDHAVMLNAQSAFSDAYAGASLVLADGAPIVWTSRLLGRSLPQRVAGSDLVPALFARVSRQASPRAPRLRVFLLGAAPGVGDRAAQAIVHQWQGIDVVGIDSPPIGFQSDPVENQRILEKIEAARPDLVLVGLGAPKQELWVHAHAAKMKAKAALCVGATIDFLAGEKRRAPQWMQHVGLEWLHRVATEPRRLVRRYVRDALLFPPLVWRDLLRS